MFGSMEWVNRLGKASARGRWCNQVSSQKKAESPFLVRTNEICLSSGSCLFTIIGIKDLCLCGCRVGWGWWRPNQVIQGASIGRSILKANFISRQIFCVCIFLMPRPPCSLGLQTFFYAIRH